MFFEKFVFDDFQSFSCGKLIEDRPEKLGVFWGEISQSLLIRVIRIFIVGGSARILASRTRMEKKVSTFL